MKAQIEETSFYVKRLANFLRDEKKYIYNLVSDGSIQNTGTLPLIDSLINATDELNIILGDENSNSLINQQIQLQGITNQGVFELQQLQGVTDSLKVVSELKSSQLSPEDSGAKFNQILNHLCDNARSLIQNQTNLNKDPSQNQNLFSATQNVLYHSLEKLSYQPQNEINPNTYNPNIETNDKIKNDSEQLISKTNAIMIPLLQDLELQMNKFIDCDFVNYAQLATIGMSYIESIETMKNAYMDCEKQTQNGVKEVFETTLKQKAEKVKEQTEFLSKINASPEFCSKIGNANIEQLSISALHIREYISPSDPTYTLSAEMHNELDQIINTQIQLVKANPDNTKDM